MRSRRDNDFVIRPEILCVMGASPMLLLDASIDNSTGLATISRVAT
jgi:hypothetical protein